MQKTVVGIFEYESDAQNAQNYLLANGFGDGDVDIKTARYKSEATDTLPDDEEPDLFDRIGNFFKELFSDEHDDTEHYIEAGKRGTIVTVHAKSADEAVAAAHIMDDYGALDVTNQGRTHQPGEQYEDPIVNPPSVSDGDTVIPASVDARGPYFRSRIIDRPLQPQHRLGQRNFSADNPAGTSAQEPELHKTIAERDALINEIVDNDRLKSE